MTRVEDLEPFVGQSTDDGEIAKQALGLLDGVLGSLEDLDARIADVVKHWKMDRIAPIDRSILRLALYEFHEASSVPPKVAINEAIELAKKYSTEQSGAFVNGVLDRIYHDLLEADMEKAEVSPARPDPEE